MSEKDTDQSAYRSPGKTIPIIEKHLNSKHDKHTTQIVFAILVRKNITKRMCFNRNGDGSVFTVRKHKNDSQQTRSIGIFIFLKLWLNDVITHWAMCNHLLTL